MEGLTYERLLKLLDKWDDVSAAIDVIVVAQPSRMSEAAERLERVRKEMRTLINEVTRP